MAVEDYFDTSRVPDEWDVDERYAGPVYQPRKGVLFENNSAKREANRRAGRPTNHGLPWPLSVDDQLRALVNQGLSIDKIAKRMGRTPLAIISRMDQTGLRTPNPNALAVPAAVNNEGLNVKLTHLTTLLQEGYTTVSVLLHGKSGPAYTYKAPLDMGLKTGDRVVVYANDQLTVGTVSKVDERPNIDFNAPYALKWVVQRVDLEQYDRQQENEAAALAELTQVQQRKMQEETIKMLFGSDQKLEDIRKLLAR